MATGAYDTADKRWKAVIQEFASNGFNKQAAYAAAYKKAKPESANTAGPRLFRNVRFIAALDDYLSQRIMTKSEALSRMAELAQDENKRIRSDALDKLLKAHGAYGATGRAGDEHTHRLIVEYATAADKPRET